MQFISRIKAQRARLVATGRMLDQGREVKRAVMSPQPQLATAVERRK